MAKKPEPDSWQLLPFWMVFIPFEGRQNERARARELHERLHYYIQLLQILLVKEAGHP